MGLYCYDVGTDIALAVHYFQGGDNYWGGFTIAFVAAPWILYAISAVFIVKTVESAKPYKALLLTLAIFNLVPIGFLLVALKEMFVKNREPEALESKRTATLVKLVEVVFEAFPKRRFKCI